MTLDKLIEKLKDVRNKYKGPYDEPEMLTEFFIGIDSEDGLNYISLDDVKSLNIAEDDNFGTCVMMCFHKTVSEESEEIDAE